MSALPAVAGSTISVMLAAFVVWAVVSLLLSRFPFRLTDSDRQIAGVLTLFVALIVVTALIGDNLGQMPAATLWVLPFLGPWVVIPRLRATPDVDYLRYYAIGAGAGAIVAAVFGLVEIVVLGERPEGGAGNAAVFGMISLCLGAIAGLNVYSPVRWERRLAAAGAVAGLLAVVLSLTRGVVLAAILVMIVQLFYSRASLRSASARMIAVAAAIVAAISFYVASDLLIGRVYQTVDEIDLVLSGENSDNIGERLRLWTASWQIIGESPFWGHGIQNRMDKVAVLLSQDGPFRSFTHVHNAFLTFAIDGGLLVLCALIAVLVVPPVVAWRAERDANHRKRFFMALQVCLIYATCGLTQIMFKHDIMDSFFIFSMIVVAASIPASRVHVAQEKTPTA